MKKILIPTDFSDNAGAALQYALELFKEANVDIHIIHAVTPAVILTDIGSSGVQVSQKEIDNAASTMSAIEHFCKLYLSEEKIENISISTSVKVGGVIQCMKETAIELETDLIIMGTQGNNHNYMEKIIGTTSTEILDSEICPVILVPNGYEFKPIDNIIFSTNLNHGDPYELWQAMELLEPNEARIQCLYVSNKTTEINKKEIDVFTAYLKKNAPSIQTTFSHMENDSIEEAISEYASNVNAELIMMLRSKKSFWKDLFSRRHTNKMAFLADVPLMVLV